MLNKWIKLGVFILLIFIVNLFMFRSGLWFYQDTSYWYKNTYELLSGFYYGLMPYTNYGYFLSYDIGLFTFTRIIPNLLTLILFLLFGSSISQVLFTIVGLIANFICFYLFSSILFKNKNIKYVISLLFTFIPLIISAEGFTIIFAGVPLFLYSFYNFFSKVNNTRFIYLLINIIASYLILTYIRYIGIGFIIILFYFIYFFTSKQIFVTVKKILCYIAAYFVLFLPSIYSLLAQINEKSNTAFNYGTIFQGKIQHVNFIQSFNYFYSFNVTPYDNLYYLVLGIVVFILLFLGLVKFKKPTFLLLVNLVLLILGISLYGLNNIFNNYIFNKLITFFPFIVNGPYWAFFISTFSLPIIIGIIFGVNKKVFYIVSTLIIVITLIPYININQFQFRKYQISSIPKPYYDNFIEPFYGVPEATQYIPGLCWRAEYMQKADVPTMCVNFGLKFSPIALANPRVLSGKDYYLSTLLNNNINLNNLRVTHNLKNIIIANDIVKTKGPGPLTSDEDIAKTKQLNVDLSKNQLLAVDSNPNFNRYYFKNKNDYDFFIYSPRTVIYKQKIEDIFDNSLDINKTPVVIDNNKINLNSSYQSVKVAYMIDTLNPTKYIVKLSNIDKNIPIILQMNQSFNKNWKAYLVDEDTFNNAPCLTGWTDFKITNNSRCQFKNTSLDLNDINLLISNKYEIKNHFQSNFIGNGWLLNPNEFESKISKNGELYLVLIYEKQVYYSFAILIAISGLGIILALVLIQEIYLRYRNRI